MTALLYRDATGAQRSFPLREELGTVTLGRRREADVSLPWDQEVSRLHAELTPLAGEWVLTDDGTSQNGTYVNGLPVEGRRRLRDGDLIRVGRTTLTFCDPDSPEAAITLASAELQPVRTFSEQQQRILRDLCRPLLGDGQGVVAARDEEIAASLELPLSVVTVELDQLARAFGLDDLPLAERRTETGLVALRSGLVQPDQGG